MIACILAGQPNDGRLRQISEAAYEAEILIAGQPMVQYVTRALQDAQHIDRLIFLGPQALCPPAAQYVPMQNDLLSNLLAVVQAIEPTQREQPVMIVTADVPLITGPMLDRMIEQMPSQLDIVYPIVEKSEMLRAFPCAQRTYVRLWDGTFTGGNVFLVKPAAILRVQDRLQDFFSHRKSPLQLAKDIGWDFVWKLLWHRLTLQAARQRLEKILAIKGQAWPVPWPEIGMDVDKAADWEAAEKLLNLAEGLEGHDGKRDAGTKFLS
ncbi:MAG: NTP transferase domain-containing protein [Firmicutes bacterium]|nr:NTP transferase domain-containing protein [Bacillota bacterium]